MRIASVSDSLRSPRVPYPWHMTGGNSEENFYDWVVPHAAEIKTDLIYLPIFWWNNSYWQTYHKKMPNGDFYPVPEAQALLDRLDPNERYFTVSNCDDGIYEDLPPNVTVFNAGGCGDIPIPLLGDPYPLRDCTKTIPGSFVGVIETGGPVNPKIKAKCSSWDVNGPGATIRRHMQRAFTGHEGWWIEDRQGSNPDNLELFRATAAASRFALAPRGYGKTSYRLFEALDFRAVPVYIYDELWLPYLDQLDWQRFAVVCHKSELDGLPDRLQGISEEQRSKMVGEGQKCHPHFFTRAARNQQIARYVERMS